MSLDVINPANHEAIINAIEHPGAERNVLACILRDNDKIYDVADKLKEEDFNNSINQVIYRVMLRLSEKGIATSKENILAVTRGNDILDKLGEEYLHRIAQVDTTGIDLEYNANLVLTASIKRKAYLAGLQLLKDCVDESFAPDDADTFIGQQQQRIMEISLESRSNKVQHVGHGLDEWFEKVVSNPTDIPGIRSGFPELDKAIGGFRPGRMYVFAARSKQGKSLLLNNFAAHIAINEGVPVLYLDTEMSLEEDVRPRLLAIVSGVDENLISTGMYTKDPEATEKVERAKEILKHTPIHHAYIPAFNTNQVLSIVRKHYVKDKIGALFFDYIKLPMNGGGGNLQEYQMLGLLTAALKDLGGELGIPVLTAAQLNRSAVDIDGDEYNEGMVAGSDRILQNASYLFYFWRKTEQQMAEDGGEDTGNACLKLGESRHGGDYFGWLKAHPGNARIQELIRV